MIVAGIKISEAEAIRENYTKWDLKYADEARRS